MTEAFKEHDKSLNSVRDLSGRFCERPFELMEIHREFYAFACCPSWLPTIIGNCETSDLMDVWNSQKAQAVREGVLNGSFSHCDHLECPRIQAGTLPHISIYRRAIALSMRRAKLSWTSRPRKSHFAMTIPAISHVRVAGRSKSWTSPGKASIGSFEFTDKLIAQLLDQARVQVVWLRVTGSGDPVASKVFRHLLTTIDGRDLPNLRIVLQTNAVMLTPKVWSEMRGIHGNVHSISISIDAATETTYIKTRRLGNWRQLMENMRFIAHLLRQGDIQRLDCNFVVQTENYKEMGDFVSLCTNLGPIHKIFFSLVNDWGLGRQMNTLINAIWKIDHPEFEHFLEALRDPRLDHPAVDLGNLTAYQSRAMDRQPSAQADPNLDFAL